MDGLYRNSHGYHELKSKFVRKTRSKLSLVISRRCCVEEERIVINIGIAPVRQALASLFIYTGDNKYILLTKGEIKMAGY